MEGLSVAQLGAGQGPAEPLGASDARAPVAAHVSDAELLELGRQVLQGQDIDRMSLVVFRNQLAVLAGLGEKGLDDRSQDVCALATRLVAELSSDKPDWLTTEDPAARTCVYLVTFAGVLDSTALQAPTPLQTLDTFDRQKIRDAVLDAVANATFGAHGGRPCKEKPHVKKMVVFLETPRHFHVALLLSTRVKFLPMKQALRTRSGLASHWSTSHTMFWSVVRYGVFTTVRKPVVDEAPLKWTSSDVSGESFDLYQESQEPWNAGAVKRRREIAEEKAAGAAVEGSAAKKANGEAAKFNKYDFTALVIAEQIWTPSAVIAHVQDKGSKAMQAFVNRHQRKLPEMLSDAREWQNASEVAARERETDWELIQRLAGEPCVCGCERCPWDIARQAFFERNAPSIDEGALAHCLARVICEGPSKTVRIPLIAGPSNSAKSTVLDPVDEVFGATNVQHKPDLGSTMPLVNMTKAHKRFMYLDEFQCVEYCAVPARKPTIPVTTMLKLFGGQYLEVQVSQSFHDGNLDCRWRRGVAITSKVKDLWEPKGPVTAEDITHLQNRIQQFTAVAKLKRCELKPIAPCKFSFCKWLVAASTRFATGTVPSGVGAAGEPQTAEADLVLPERAEAMPSDVVAGFHELMVEASIPQNLAKPLHDAVLGLGAVAVEEVAPEDWAALPCWGTLKVLQQRRLLTAARNRARPQHS